MTSNSNILTGIVLSLLVHAIAFAHWESDFKFNKSASSAENKSKHINIQLVKHAPPVKETIKQNRVKENKVIPVTSKKTLTTRKVAIDKPVEIAQTQKLPAVKPQEKEVSENIPENIASTPDETLIDQHFIEITQEKEKEAYIQLLLAHIEAYKFYPGAARRRAIEGKLDVTFLLSKEGEHIQLTIDGGKTVLQRAVRQALNDAQPFPKPPSSIESNQRIAFSMYYKLTDMN